MLPDKKRTSKDFINISKHPPVNGLFLLIFTFIIAIIGSGCKKKSHEYFILSGNAFGENYTLTISTQDTTRIKHTVDSIFTSVFRVFNSHDDQSIISKFNAADRMFCLDTEDGSHFETVFKKAQNLYQKTKGALDPSIAPFIAYYGFDTPDSAPLEAIDTTEVKRLLALVQFDKISLNHGENNKICLTKPEKDVKISLNALSPGYAVDVVSSYLENLKIHNYKVVLGQEIRTMGHDPNNKSWNITIDRPSDNRTIDNVELPLLLSNKAMATNGNYKAMYEKNGIKFSHIINPFTGYSYPTDILSVSVIAEDCVTAYAYTTAFMVLGVEKSLALTEQLKDVEACFIYDKDEDGVPEFSVSSGFPKYYLNYEQK